MTKNGPVTIESFFELSKWMQQTIAIHEAAHAIRGDVSDLFLAIVEQAPEIASRALAQARLDRQNTIWMLAADVEVN